MEELVRAEGEQQEQFERILEACGSETLSYFCCCAAFDVPFYPKDVPVGETSSQWVEYMKRLRLRGHDKKGKAKFRDGETDLLRFYGDGVTPEEASEAVRAERKTAKKRQKQASLGTEQQISDWGTGGETNPLTKDDYDRLDYFYHTLTSRLSYGVDTQQELILRKVASLYHEEEKLRADGNFADAQKCVKMALDLLSSEQLQKKDEKPVEDVRIDSIIDALEKWGAVRDGKILSFPDLTEFLLKELGRLGGEPAHKYTSTMDAADYMLLFIQNCMAQNEDLPKWMELPDNMRFGEEVAHEFSEAPTDDEKRAYEGIGIVRKAGSKHKKG